MQKCIKEIIESVGYSFGGTLSNLLSHHTGISSTVIAPIGSQHIVDKHKDYFKFDDSKYTQNESAILAQVNSIGIPTNTEISHAGGVIYVEPYVRADGTPVRGYYRAV